VPELRRGIFGGRPRRARTPTLVPLLLLSFASALLHPGPSLALVGSSRTLSGNTFVTGTWYFLHNNPTPPTANTIAQADLTVTGTVSTQATLYNYDTNADSIAGRQIQKSGSGAGDTTLARYANWQTPAFATARTISGTVTVRIWAGVTGFPLGVMGVLVAYLRDFRPQGSKYTEIANATLSDGNFQHCVAGWVQKTITVSVAGYTVPAGDQLELKIETTSAAYANMILAYDTTLYPAVLSLP
jgi:hypothetical protein